MAVNWVQQLANLQDPGVIIKLATAIATLAALHSLHFDDNGVLVAD
jgi:hypothetical protein